MRIPLALAYFVLVELALSGTLLAQERPTLADSDSALVEHIKKWDPVLQNFLRECWEEKLTRTTDGGQQLFEYTALCRFRQKPEQAGDCGHYEVQAQGTIDSNAWATIRRWSLELKCSA